MADQRSLRSFSLIFPYFNTTYTPLADVATVLRAPLFKDQAGAGGERFHVISIKDFPEAGYLPPPRREIILQDRADKARGYAVRPFDLLVTMAGTIGHTTLVPETCGANWIPATNMFVIRLRETDPAAARALYALFRSSGGQDILNTLAHGRGIQIISKKQFAGILIPELRTDVLARTEQLWADQLRLYHDGLRLLERSRQVYGMLEDDTVDVREIS